MGLAQGDLEEAHLVLSRGSHVPSGSGSSWGDQDGRRWIPRPRGPDSVGASPAATPSPGGLQRKGKLGTRGRSWPSEVRWGVFHSLHLIPKRLHDVSDLITPKELTLST